MKKNDWSILISVLAYSILFYKQGAGLNFFIFSCVIIALLLYRNVALLKSKMWLSVAAGALVTSFSIYMYDSPLAIWGNLFALFILPVVSLEPRTSFLTSILLSICSYSTSCVFMFIDWVKRKKQDVSEAYKRPFYVKLFLILIPFLIAVLFFFFYQTANPLFYNFTKDINLDWISIGWIFFTYSGLLLMYGFFHSLRLKGIADVDVNASLNLSPEIAERKNFLNGLMRMDTEAISGVILFSMLNGLLLLLNVLDFNYLVFDGKLPEGINHKGFVHDGIGTLIISIIVAILIILFYFRGTQNYYNKSKWLRIMAYIWIAQNAFMIFSTAYRNNLYIQESGLSYKKIGVYVYLLLVLIGLLTTFVKVAKLKTNWYLFRVNAAIYFNILFFASIFNWDMIITEYNIKKNKEEKKELEKYLLLDLSFKNLPQLYQLPDSIVMKDNVKAREYYNLVHETWYNNFKAERDRKLYYFLDDYIQLEWPSLCMEKTRVYQELFESRNNMKELIFETAYIKSLKPLQMYDGLQSLHLESDYLTDLSELKMFPRLEKLTLRSCGLDTITAFPSFVALRELDLSNNNISDINSLRKCRNIEVLNLSGQNHIESYAPLVAMKKLKHLTIGEITPEGLDSLQKTFPNVKIDANVINIRSAR